MLHPRFHHRIRLCFLLVMLVAVLASPSVWAEDSVSQITYRGRLQGFRFEPGSAYTNSDLFAAFKQVMPGDSLRQQIQFTNAARDCSSMRLYLQAIPHDATANPVQMTQSPTLAPWQDYPTMQQFLTQMTLHVWQGETLLSLDSADQTAGLTQPVLLGTFKPGETTLLTLQLDVDPAMTNADAYHAGEIDWQFLVECCDFPDPPVPSPPPGPKPCPVPDGGGTLIQTGLQNLPVLVLAIAGLLLLLWGYWRRRH